MKQRNDNQRRELLKAERLSRQWSQNDLAEQLGVTVVTVSRWEQGVSTPGPYFRLKLCALYGKEAAELGLLPAVSVPLFEEVTEIRLSCFDPIIPAPQQEQFPLVGREKALQDVVTYLCTHARAAYALVGLPGVGKTSLAIALAHHPRIREHFRDGILWAGLGSTPQLSETLSRWGGLLQVNVADFQGLTAPEAWARCLHQYIGTRRMLLILDDAWKLADAVSMHIGGNECAHLLTTRFPILGHGFAGEHVMHLRELTSNESLALLRQLAPHVPPEELTDIQNLAQTVGGLPLALTLLGRYLHVQSLSGPPRRLAQKIHLLCEDMRARLQLEEPLTSWTFTPNYAPGAAMSLRFAIDLSVQHLPESARNALAALALFPSKPYTFAEEAALAVGDMSTETLDLLVDSGLVEISLQGRYQLHQTVADYARLQGDDPAAERRLVDFMLTFLEAHQQDFPALEQDLHILTTALDSAAASNLDELFCTGAFLLMPFLEHQHLYTLAESLLARVHARTMQKENREGQARVCLWRGSLAEQRGDLRLAQQTYLSGLVLARQVQRRDLLAQLLVKTGGALVKAADSWPQAEAYLIEGLHALEEIQESVPQTPSCLIFQLLGELAGSLGDGEKAHAFYQHGLELARRDQQWQVASAILQNLGVLQSWRGNLGEAANYYQESFSYAKCTDDLQRQCALLMNMGMLAWRQKDQEHALELSLESLQLAREIGNNRRVSMILQNLGMMMRHRDQEQQAAAYLEESLALARQGGDHWLTCETLGEWGALYLQQGQIEHARQMFEKMHEQAEAIEVPMLIAHSLFGLAQVAEIEGQHSLAMKLVRKSRAMFTQLKHHLWIQDIDNWLAANHRA